MSSLNDINNTTNLNNLNEQTINDIKNLQSIELELFNTLENNLTNETLTSTQQNDIINKINEVSQMRIKMYKNLTSFYSAYQQNISSYDTTLQQQLQALSIAEEQLNNLRLQLNELQNNNFNKLRLIQINNYYGKKYNAYSSILFNVIIICIIILVLSILKKKEILPSNIYNLSIILVFVISIIIITSKFYDISLRDNMNFDEYNWRFTPPKSTSTTTTTDTTNVWGDESSNICIGNDCCRDNEEYWDSTTNKCVPITQPNTTTSTNNVTDIFGKVDLSQTKNCNSSTSTETFKSSPFSYL